MLDLGRHGEFVWLSYGFAAIVVVAIVAWLILDGRRQSRQLALLEAQGRGRRSSSAAPGNPASATNNSQVASTPKEG